MFAHYSGAQARGMAWQLVGLLVDVFGTSAPQGSPRFGRIGALKRLWAYSRQDGYELVTARHDGALVGYAAGYTLPVGTHWWCGITPPPPESETIETGRRTFAVTELVVRAPYRARGVGGQLIRQLLSGRGEERATFGTEDGNDVVRGYAERHGWTYVGRQRPFPTEKPVMLVYLTRIGEHLASPRQDLVDHDETAHDRGDHDLEVMIDA